MKMNLIRQTLDDLSTALKTALGVNPTFLGSEELKAALGEIAVFEAQFTARGG